MSTGYPSDWDSRRKTVYQRDDYTCQNCGAMGGPQGHAELHAHHIVPKSRGGTHSTSNLISLCSECHNTVHSKSKQAPAPHQQSVGESFEYGQLSDAIVEDIATIASSITEVATVTESRDASLNQEVDELEMTAIELRPLIMQVTDAIETLDTVSSSNYPRELVRHDKKTFESATEYMILGLEWMESRSNQIGSLVEDMYSCPECDGAVDVEEQEYCSNCGAKLQLGPNCPGCGEEVLGTDDFCSSCGESLDDIEDERGVGKKVEEIMNDIESKEEMLIKKTDNMREMFEERNRIINKHSQF